MRDVRDALLIGPWHHPGERSNTHRRTPTDYEAEHTMVRTIRCVSGEVQMIVECEPMFDYGRNLAHWSYTDHVYHQGKAEAQGVDIPLRLTTDMRLGFEGGRASSRTMCRDPI